MASFPMGLVVFVSNMCVVGCFVVLGSSFVGSGVSVIGGVPSLIHGNSTRNKVKKFRKAYLT